MTEQSPAPAGPDALTAWVTATLPRATAYARSLLSEAAAADDVVHDCFCRLLQKATVYDLPHDGARLLFRAITNACIDRSRQRPVLPLTRNGLADRRSHEPVEALAQQELEQAVTAALAQLPMQQRAAVELKSLGHSQQEIAATLSVSVSHAGVLIHRARQTLARTLGRFLAEAPL